MHLPNFTGLAQIDQNQAFGTVIICAVVLGLVVVGAALAMWVRKRIAADDSKAPGGFTLGDVRALHRAGKMTDQEFEKAKTKILAATKIKAGREIDDSHPDLARDRAKGDGQ